MGNLFRRPKEEFDCEQAAPATAANLKPASHRPVRERVESAFRGWAIVRVGIGRYRCNRWDDDGRGSRRIVESAYVVARLDGALEVRRAKGVVEMIES